MIDLIQNEEARVVFYWLRRGLWDMSGGLAEHAFGVKGYMAHKWDTSRVFIYLPRPAGGRTTAELLDQGIVGLYAERV